MTEPSILILNCPRIGSLHYWCCRTIYYHVDNVSTGKTEKTLIISDTIQPIFIKFSLKWWHCVRQYNSCNIWPEKSTSSQNLQQNNISFWSTNISKQKLQRQISLTVISNHINFKGFRQCLSCLFPKMLLQIRLFQVEWKTKMVTDLWDYSTFSRHFTDCDRRTQVLKNVRPDREDSATTDLFFMWKMDCMETSGTSL